MRAHGWTLVSVGEPTREHSRDFRLAAEAEHVGRRDPAPLVTFALEHALDAPERPLVAAASELGCGRPALCVVACRKAT
jgi:hypothetical protein